MAPNKAFILAAGFGTRLRPITDAHPKPMAEVTGETLIMRTIDHLKAAGIREMVVNTHYRGAQLAAHLETRTDLKIHISHEPEILDTGGGIKNALHHFGGEDFLVLSGDGLWSDGPSGNTITNLINNWKPTRMDILMLLQATNSMTITKSIGDYDLNADGKAVRAKDQSGAHMFTSMRINSSRIFNRAPGSPFSYLQLMDKVESEGRLYGLVNDGDWHHISTPADLDAVNALYEGNGE